MRFLTGLLAFVSLAATAQVPPDLRLPEGARPLRYAAELTIVPDRGEFTGKVRIDIALERPTALLWLNARFLKVERASAGGRPAEILPGGAHFVGLRLPSPLPAGESVLALEYRGELSDRDVLGAFRMKEGEHWYAYTQFEPFHARRAFPCFDEPSFKVPWQLALVVRAEHVAVSNTPVVSETPLPDGMKRVLFAPTRPLPSYLIAFGVGPFDIVDAGTAGVKQTPVRIITPRGQASLARYAAEVTPRILAMVEEYVGVPHPYEKLDNIAVPRPFGAMENPGLMTYASNAILARPQAETERFRQGYAHLAAHEIAHTWFGDLVTHAWWDDLWLNESFATWLSDKIADRFEPGWRMLARSALGRDNAMKNDSLMSARRIRQPITSYGDIVNAFDPITYAKGGAVLGMFEDWLGEERFRRVLKGYLDRHADGVASAREFLAALSADAGEQAGAAFSTFLEQAGLPFVDMELTCGPTGARLALRQQRYLPLGSRAAAGAAPVWQMPVCVRHGGATAQRACVLMTGMSAELPLGAGCPRWVEPEPARYYRARYLGKSDSTSAASAVSRISDLASLATNGSLAVDAALELAQAETRTGTPEVMQGFFNMVGELRALMPPALSGNRARWLDRLLGERARALGLAPLAQDSADAARLRPQLAGFLLTHGADTALGAEATRLTLKWLEDRSAVDGALVDTVLAGAARSGDRPLFERLRAAAAATADRRERRSLFAALGTFADPALAREALQMVLDPAHDYREASTILWTMSNQLETAGIAWRFMQENFDALVARAPRDAAAFFPRLANGFCDSASRADVEAFFRDRAPRYTGGPRNLAQVLERISVCIAFKERQQAAMSRFLARH